MKSIGLGKVLVLSIILIGCLFSCSSDDGDSVFYSLTIEDIKTRESNMSASNIVATNSAGYILKVGDVIMYKTNGNRYGKLEIAGFRDIDNKKLTLNAVTYNDDGSVYIQRSNLGIRGAFRCNLDTMSETSSDIADFEWQRVNPDDTNLRPLGIAVFARY